MKNKIKKEIEYEDAPSGNVAFYNYKEPLMPYEGGYGFIGALVFDSETDQVQCHMCGAWFKYLPPHITKEHNMRANQYKDLVGLNQTTALISETMRASLIAGGLDKRLQNLRKGGKKTPEQRAKIGATLRKFTPEMQNLRNTCPAQLLERLRNKYIELGRTPSEKQMSCREAILRVYGTYREACKLAGIPEPIRAGQTHKNIEGRIKWNKKVCVEWVRNYVDINGKLPNSGSHKNMWPAILRHGKKEIFIEALGGDGTYRKIDLNMQYTKPQLLNFLRHFAEINKRKPSYSDCKRGLLPHLSRYSYHFGSWKNSLALAFD